MFSFSGNLLAGQHDTQKKRPPPSKPIPVTFPSYEPSRPETTFEPPSWASGGQPGMAAHFLKLKRPSDVNEDTLSTLNVTFQPECEFETFLSGLSNNAQAHLPPRDWLEPPEHIDLLMGSGSDVALLSNGRRVPDHKEFYMRARELLFPNGDAFSTLTRKSRGGPVTLRLAHFRKFWEGLDNLAYYWDNTLDEYHPPSPSTESVEQTGKTGPASSVLTTNSQGQETQSETKADQDSTLKPGPSVPNGEEPRKKARTDGTKTNSNGFSVGTIEPRTPSTAARVLPARAAPPRIPWVANSEPHNKPLDLSNGYYRGYRIGNGAEMPDQYRIDCVRAFLEPIAWAFGVTLAQHRRPPVLQFEHVRFPVRMSSAAWRAHPDRMKARQGCVQGPVMGMQCRADVNFGASGNLRSESVLDVVRELGGLLLLAQERLREGRSERRSGEGKWWTTKPRWGGGPGGEVGDAQGSSDGPKDESAQQPEQSVQRNPDGSKTRRRPTPAEIWKTLKPGQLLWDPKVVYEAIGKDQTVAWDDVFMVSSLNHHISVLRLRVHPCYLDYLTYGVLPEKQPAESDWFSPKLQRTRWFDLFDVGDRTEAMRGIWGIMSYLMRKQEGPARDTKMQ